MSDTLAIVITILQPNVIVEYYFLCVYDCLYDIKFFEAGAFSSAVKVGIFRTPCKTAIPDSF